MRRRTEKERIKLLMECAKYCVEYNWSIRVIARNVGLSRSTVHRYLTDDLKYIDYSLYEKCKNKLKERRTSW